MVDRTVEHVNLTQPAERLLDPFALDGADAIAGMSGGARFDRLADTGSLVRRNIVDHDDVLALEGWGETSFDIGQELLSGH